MDVNIQRAIEIKKKGFYQYTPSDIEFLFNVYNFNHSEKLENKGGCGSCRRQKINKIEIWLGKIERNEIPS